MGCVTSTAKRRRRQAKAGYTHIAKKDRPYYSKSAGGGEQRLNGQPSKKN